MNEKQIKQSYDAIQLPPGAEERLQERIDAALDKPMAETRIVLRPRKAAWRTVFAAAAAMALLLLGVAGFSRLHTTQEAQVVPSRGTEQETALTPGEMKYYLSKYEPILDSYRTALAEEPDEEECKELGVSPLCRDFFGKSPLHRIGYCLADLNGDGVPELLIGCTEQEPAYGDAVLDLYTLVLYTPQKFAESRENQYCYDCGGGLLRMESHVVGNKTSMASWVLYDLTVFPKRLVAELSVSPDWDAPHYLIPAEDEETGSVKIGELVEVPMSREEADAWLERYCSSNVKHSYKPFDEADRSEQPTATPETVSNTTSLRDEDYARVLRTLSVIGQKDEPYALADYAAPQSDGVAILLEQIGEVAERRGITEAQIRGLFYGRSNLDDLSAKAYATLLGKLHQSYPISFIRAWHDTGEPLVLLYEVTGTTNAEESYLFLMTEWMEYNLRSQSENNSTGENR